MNVDIDKRSFEFALKIIQLINDLPKTTAGNAIGQQIIRSGTSIGANVQEALGAHSKSDFIYKMNIAKSEARETKYWLKLLIGSQLIVSSQIEWLLSEVDELVAILTTIVKNTKKNL